MAIKLLIISLLSLLAVAVCEHLIVGDVNGKNIINHTVQQYNKIPFLKREKDYFYTDASQRNINAIIVYDNIENRHSKASATITAGGVGYSYVNIRMKSERGEGLDYDIGIYS